MYKFEVTLSGNGVIDGPINHFILPVLTISELQDYQEKAREIIVDVFDPSGPGKLLYNTFYKHGISSLLTGSTSISSYTALDGSSLPKAKQPTTALLEASGLLPNNTSLYCQTQDGTNITATFKNGTTANIFFDLGYQVIVALDNIQNPTLGYRLNWPQSTMASTQSLLSLAKRSDNRFVQWDFQEVLIEHTFQLSSSQLSKWRNILTNETPDIVDTDPYNPGGGNTEPGGGEGNPDDTNIPVDFPSLPTVGGGEGVADSGLISLFNPSLTQIRDLAAYMWNTSLFDLSTWQKLFADPMDAIISLSIVPINVPSSTSKVVKVGNISTGISMNVASKQFIEFDCGSISIEEFWAAYLDYEPFTKFEIYLPYIGSKELSTNDIMAKTISLKYHIDILSGACIAYLKCGDSILYNWNGHCSMQIPLSAADMATMITGILGIFSGAATTIGGAAGGNFSVAAKGAAQMASNAVNNLKPTIEKSGSIGSAAGILGIQTPYLIITRPRQALPSYQNKYTGYPSFMTVALSSLNGFTIVEEIHLQNVPATTNELAEIEELLKQGVII